MTRHRASMRASKLLKMPSITNITGMNSLQALLQANAANLAAAPNAVWASVRRVLLRENIAARIEQPTSMVRCALPKWRRPMVTCARQVLISSATFLSPSPTFLMQTAEPSLWTTFKETLISHLLVLLIQIRACVLMDAKSLIMITNALGLGPQVNLNSLMPRECSAAFLRTSEV